MGTIDVWLIVLVLIVGNAAVPAAGEEKDCG